MAPSISSKFRVQGSKLMGLEFCGQNLKPCAPYPISKAISSRPATREIASNFETIFISGAISYEELASE
jgi:hypothetical protein